MNRNFFSHPTFVHCLGKDIRASLETTDDLRRLDHIWITMEVKSTELLTLSINTLSKRNRDAGFDSRIHVGIVEDKWDKPPSLVFERCERFDYAEFEHSAKITYTPYDRVEMERFIFNRCDRAQFLEAWGLTYSRHHFGIHQVHCRWGSCAIPEDVRGRDGALRFYYPNGERELVLLKFCGQ